MQVIACELQREVSTTSEQHITLQYPVKDLGGAIFMKVYHLLIDRADAIKIRLH